MSENRKSTRQLLAKIPNVPCLYRHKLNGTYYGVKKAGSKHKNHSLGTANRKLAERKLKKWLDDLDRIDARAAKITIAALLEKLLAVNQGKAEKTRATDQSIINVFRRTWRHGLNMRVGEIHSTTAVRIAGTGVWTLFHETTCGGALPFRAPARCRNSDTPISPA